MRLSRVLFIYKFNFYYPVKLPTKNFLSYEGALIPQPDLLSVQTDSYKWFVERGLKELCQEISPIKDYADKHLELYFGNYYFDEPKYSEIESIAKGITYECPLRAKVKLVNKANKSNKEQEVYLGDFPVMTERGTFIINGIERVVISQLVRSPGIYFLSEFYRGKKIFTAKLIPNRGTWLEFETDATGTLSVKIDRHRKVA